MYAHIRWHMQSQWHFAVSRSTLYNLFFRLCCYRVKVYCTLTAENHIIIERWTPTIHSQQWKLNLVFVDCTEENMSLPIQHAIRARPLKNIGFQLSSSSSDQAT